MSKSKPSLPRGTRDFGPEISAKRSYIIDKIKHNFIKYGFSQLETPAMENLSTLTGKYGDEGDQLLFKIIESGDYLQKAKLNLAQKKQIHKYASEFIKCFNQAVLSIPSSTPSLRFSFIAEKFKNQLDFNVDFFDDKNDREIFKLLTNELYTDILVKILTSDGFNLDNPLSTVTDTLENLDRIYELLVTWFFNKISSKEFTPSISTKGLRYDLTVPFARFVVMNQNEISFPFKRFQIQPVWRADRPQKGRYREFYQCDADIIGSKGIWNEAEFTLLINDVFKDLKLEDYTILVNHRDILFLLADYVGLKEKAIPFCAEIDKLDKIGKDKVIENITSLGADSNKLNEVIELISITDRDELIEKVRAIDSENRGVKEIISYFETLDQFKDKNLKVELDLSLARGLSYYTGVIYEVKPTSVKMGSICGGGRYDDLTGVFGLNGISGIGISFGLDRIYDVMEELKLFPDNITQPLDVLIVHFSQANLMHGQKVVMQLREAGIKAELFPDTDKIKKQFNYADKIRTPFTLIIGDNEMESGEYMLKNMESGEQKALDLDKIIQHFKG